MRDGDDQNAINNERQLKEAVSVESAKFEESYRWLEKSMGADFFRDIPHERIVLIAHNLISFELQSYFMTIFLEDSALVLCLDNPRADIEVLEQLSLHGIRGYQTYQSQQPYRGAKKEGLLRIVSVSFTTVPTTSEQMQSEESIANLFAIVNQRAPEVTEEEFNQMIMGMQGPLLRTLPKDRSAAAVEMFLRSRTRDNCQYEVFYHEDWMQTGEPSMEVLFAWRNTSKHNFLLSIAQLMFRHKLKMKRVSAAYIEPYTNRNILVMRIGIHGANGDAVWDVANTVDFMRELVTIKYFNDDDQIAHKLVSRGIIDGIHGNLLRAIVNFVHQILLNLDVNAYRLELIEEALCHHPDLTIKMIELFQLKFNPSHPSLQRFEEKKNELLSLISKLDTGNDAADTRRKNVLTQSIAFIDYCLKTNFYRRNYTAMSFRIDPQLLEHLPYDRKEFFPELPFGIFYMRGMHSIGFHVRFKDLSRGGLRTIFPRSHEQMVYERNNVFRECYNLAYTQQKKNKDIPEGGSKGVVFLYPYSQLEIEKTILTS
ncbi:MAG: NAD-glutamate dehydrogenase, partial [Chlamydiia bacterium]|nr:NAD-glutamate dehydrogenase [Chlamydiia bacterium]